MVASIDDVVASAESKKAEAPERVTPKSHVPAEDAIARLRASRDELVARVTELSRYGVSGLTYPHPFFGKLDTFQWILVTGWHERRHTRQIERVKAHPEFPAH